MSVYLALLNNKLIIAFFGMAWSILNFLLHRPQVVKVGDLSSSVIVLNTGSPQGCPCSPKMYSLFIHDCVASFPENHVFKLLKEKRGWCLKVRHATCNP